MNTTTELLQQLNTMQSEHIKVLEERIEVIIEHRQHLNETISNQAKQLQVAYTRIELGEQTESINADTIGKLFAGAKKDKEVIKQFKQLINQQGKQIIDLQKENDSLFSTSCINETTLELQKEVKKLSK